MTKTKQRLLSLTLVAAMFFALAIPASARASDYIARAIVDVSSAGNGKIAIIVDVMGKSKMQEIGVTTITVHEKKQDGSYQPVYTFTKEKNPSMIGKNRSSYLVSVTYQGVAGKDYYILAQCYAKNANGSGITMAGSRAIRA